jgi:XTP/dITP diphosphohydrolase
MPSPTPAVRPVLWIATTNRGKTREFKLLLGSRWRVKDLHDFPQLPEIRETGKTFLANASLKALALSRALPGKLILADDSGLVVPALGGRPGVRSARFSGPEATPEKNRRKLLRLMRRVSGLGRKAYFQTALVLAIDGRILGAKYGRIWGKITSVERGVGGFGYDPIFQPCGFTQTFGELSAVTKKRISHRSVAVRAMRTLLSRDKSLSRARKHI